jgi:hypothetical protein
MTLSRYAIIALAFLGLATAPALAHGRHHHAVGHHHHRAARAAVAQPQEWGVWNWGNIPVVSAAVNVGAAVARGAGIVSHPAGCPHIAFCGCGAAVKVFGYAKRDLWLAAAWLRFPRASPAPGMVAVRQHHVFVILQAYGDGTVLAYDANSGGHRTRIHRVSLAGYSVRNPHV